MRFRHVQVDCGVRGEKKGSKQSPRHDGISTPRILLAESQCSLATKKPATESPESGCLQFTRGPGMSKNFEPIGGRGLAPHQSAWVAMR